MERILIYIFAFTGGAMGIVTSIYLAAMIIGMLGYKIYRKMKFGMSLYD